MNVLTDILSAQLNQVTLSPEIRARLTPELLSKLYRISNRHDLAHIVGNTLAQNGVEIPEPMASRFKKANTLAVYRCAQHKQVLEQVGASFDAAQIPYIPLKGAVLRAFYPLESMRTGCDVDILVKREDIEGACKVLAEQGYEIQKQNYHDITLVSPTKVHLELHYTLRENMASLDGVLDRAWDYAVQEKGCQYGFTREFFVFQAFAHMSYHFLSGGCGLRSLMDIWVMDHRMGYSYSDAGTLLEEAGILQFAREMTRLAQACFDGGEWDAFTDVLLRYILSGGSYGTVQNKIAVKKTATGGTLGYVVGRLCPPYGTMKQIYPVLERMPVLLPFCWVGRWFSKMNAGRGSSAKREVQISQGISSKQETEIKEIRTRLGI